MSAPHPPPPPPAPPPGPTVPGCPACGAPLRPDQDWCLSCGTAVTTEVAGAPGWRTPIAIVSAVLLVAAVALVFAFLQLDGEADQVAVAPAATPTPAAIVPTPEPSVVPGPSGPAGPGGVSGPSGPTGPVPSATPAPAGQIARWPEGKTAFTVILYSGETRSLARAKAKSLSSVPGVGILRSGRFSSLRRGFWVVFAGQFDTLKAAQDAAKSAQSGAPGAYAKKVTPK